MRSWVGLLAGGVAAGLASGTVGAGSKADAVPPRDRSIYGHVSHIGWVVRDLDAVVAAWRALGVTSVSEPAEVELRFDGRGRGRSDRIRRVVAQFPNARVHWIQPLGGDNALTTFLAAHGEGVHHLAFRVPTPEQLDAEIASFANAGVAVVQRGPLDTPAGPGRYAYLDTAPEGGGITFELEYSPAPSPPALTSANAPPFGPVTQYAILVRDAARVSRFYERLGFGPLDIERNVSVDRRYRGKPAAFEMLLGWSRWADITFEWIQPLIGPSIYEPHLERHGDGFHHLAFHVPDMDRAVVDLQSKGLAVTMSGGWDNPGGSGRFAYFDTERHGGVALELLWVAPQGNR